MLGGDVMYQNELHPRRSFMFFCFWGHICGAFAPVALSLFDDEVPRDLVELICILVLPLLVMPVCYLIFYNSFTVEEDSAVGKHFKEIGIWLAFVFPIGIIMNLILDSDSVYALANCTYVEEIYTIYLVVYSLSIIFVTPFFKLGRMIAKSVKEANMNDMYDYHNENSKHI